jgi:outer membrane immunogenic protein
MSKYQTKFALRRGLVMTRSIMLGGLVISALLIAVPLGVANAADMAVKAPKAPPPPAFDWNGFYVGAYAGAAWMDQANTTDPCLSTALAACLAAGSGTYNGVQTTAYDMKSSFVGGFTVGANWQPTPFTLIGIENNYGWLNLKGSITQNPPPIGSGDTTAFTKMGNWYDALTARVGAVDGHAMFYLKGGAAAVREQTGVVDNGLPVTINTTTTKTQTGWAAGGGVEYGIDMHWSVKAEYLLLGVQRNIQSCAQVGGFPPGVIDCTTTHTPGIQTITVGLNYRFH